MADDGVKIDIELDLEGFEASVERANDILEDGLSGATKSAEKLEKETKKAGDEAERLGKKTQEAGEKGQSGFAKLGASAKKAFESVKNSNTSIGQMITLLSNPMVAAAALATAALAKLGQVAKAGIAKNISDEGILVALRNIQLEAGDASKIIGELGASMQVAAVADQDAFFRAATRLTQFGIAADDVIETMKMLGDVAGDDAAKLGALTESMGRIQRSGKLTSRELMGLVNNGFDPLAEMARTTGRSINDLADDMAKGAISADMVAEALKSATSEGGQYYQMSEKLAVTTQGLNQNLQNNVDQINANIMAPITALSKAYKNALVSLTGDLADFTDGFNGIAQKLASSERLWSTFALTAKTVSNAFKLMKDNIGMVLNNLKFIWDLIKQFLPDMGNLASETDTTTVVFAVFNTAMQIMNNWMALGLRTIRTLVSAFVLLGKAMQSPVVILGKLTESLAALFRGDFMSARNAIAEIPQAIGDSMAGAVEILKNEISGLVETAQKFTPSAIKSIYDTNLEQLAEASEEAKARARLSAQDVGRETAIGIIEGMDPEGIQEEADNMMSAVLYDMSHLKDEARKALKWLGDEEKAQLKELMDSIGALTEAQVKQLEGLLGQAKKTVKEYASEMVSLTSSTLSTSLGMASEILDMELAQTENHYDRMLAALEDRLARERAMLDEARRENQARRMEQEQSDYETAVRAKELDDQQLEIEKQLAAEKEALELEKAKKQEELARKQFNMDKANTITQIGIDGARAIAGLWASASSLGVAGLVWAGVQSAVIGAIMATQIGLVSSKKFVGAFEKGGIIPGSGYALVGEAGPELISVRGGERVLNNARTMQLLNNSTSNANSNVVNNITVNANAMNVGSIVDEIDRRIGRTAIARGR